MEIIRGMIPEEIKTYGSGYGSSDGYGSGDGDGSGYGSGDGYGSGNGDGDGSGYGSGNGDGDGSGYGCGSGDGSGSGYGSGDGYGSGYGSGYGCGSGDGSGYGDGDGSGYGSGYGYSDGDGYGDGQLSWLVKTRMALTAWPQVQQHRFAELEKRDVVLGLWKSNAEGLPANGGTNKIPAFPGRVEEIPGPLRVCTSHALHATMNPDHWKGTRVWVVALFGEIQQQDDKYGALKREIIGEIILTK